jgi:CLIP-associating protein 1/2
MEAVDFHTTEDLKHAVCKIVSFTAEPKSVDVRKTAQAVLIALFNLNTPEFSMMLADLPKSIQETASRILKSHINNTNNGPSTTTSQSYNSYAYKSNFFSDYINGNASSSNDDSINSGIQLSHVIKDIQNLNMNTQNNHHFNYLTTNNNNNNKDRLNSNKNDTNKMLDTLSKDSGLQSNGDVDSDSDGAMTSSSTTTTSSIANLPTISSVIATLSNNSSTMSTNEKLKSMRDLTELIKAGNRPECKWNENFKNILFCLFNHLDTSSSENNADQSLAIQTLIALRELLQFQYREFSNYIELTIMKLIEKYKESPPNELSKLVEEVICTAARCLPPEPCARVLKPLIETAEYPKNLIAIRMMQKTIDQMNIDLCSRLLPDILNALLIAWDSPHSPVRKASVFCLVSLYMVIGENLRSHLNNLSSSKIKLLNVYINRAKEAKDPHHQITA